MKQYAQSAQRADTESLCADFELEGGTFAAPVQPRFATEDDENNKDKDDMTGLDTIVRVAMPLHTAPAPNSERLELLPVNSPVKVLRDELAGDWAMVLTGGQTGFVNRNFLLKTTTSIVPGTMLYTVKDETRTPVEEVPQEKPNGSPYGVITAGFRQLETNQHYRKGKDGGIVHVEWDSLEKIIKENYPDHAQLDLRTIANALLFVNNPENDPSKGIYVKQDHPLWEKFLHKNGINYEDIVVKAGYQILLPSWSEVRRLSQEVQSGSISATLISTLWPDGFGIFFELNATCAFIAAKGRIKVGCYFVRQGNYIFLQFRGLGSLGVGKGAGTAMKLGRGQYGAGASGSADVEAMVDGFGLAEFNIPVQLGRVRSFIGRNFEELRGQGKEGAAQSFVNDFDGDTKPFLVKAVGQLGLHVTGQVSVSAGPRKAGANASQTQTGQQSSGTLNQRNSADQNVTATTLKDRVKMLKQGGKLEDVHAVGGLLGQLVSVSGGATATAEAAVGFEYEDKAGEQPSISIFVEGRAAVQVQAMIVSLGLGLGAGTKWKFVRGNDGQWYYGGQQIYLHSGELDYYSGPAYELNYNLGDTEKPRSVLDELRSLSFTKRFYIALTPGKFGRQVRVSRRFAPLMSNDARSKGATIRLAVTLEIDLAHLNPEHPDLKQLLHLARERRMKTYQIIALIRQQMDGSASVSVLRAVLQPETLRSCVLHAEVGGGAAMASRAGAHGQLDLDGAGGVVFELDVTGEVKVELAGLVAAVVGGEVERKAWLAKIIGQQEN